MDLVSRDLKSFRDAITTNNSILNEMLDTIDERTLLMKHKCNTNANSWQSILNREENSALSMNLVQSGRLFHKSKFGNHLRNQNL